MYEEDLEVDEAVYLVNRYEEDLERGNGK